jgi:hypothetical protein
MSKDNMNTIHIKCYNNLSMTSKMKYVVGILLILYRKILVVNSKIINPIE